MSDGVEVLEAHLGQRDTFTWRMERDPLLRSTIVAITTFDRAPDWPVVVDRVERMTRTTPTFREKLVPTPLGLASPRWTLDPDFDLRWHLRRVAVPAGAGFEHVLELARVAGMTAFDPARPLWEFTVVEGLPDGGAALVLKVHHALTDGIGGLELAAGVVDLTPEPADLGPLPPAPATPPHSTADGLGEAVGHDLRVLADSAARQLGALPGRALRAARDPVGAARGVVATAGSVARMVAPVRSTLSPVMTGRRLQWHYTAMAVPLDGLRDAAHAVSGTLNDAFLAGVTGGLRRYHELHGAPVDRLRLTMPISTRPPGAAAGGNQVTLARFAVPVGIADPVERIREIDRLCAGMRRQEAIPYSDAIAAALNLLPAPVTGSMLKHIDVLASNVPGWPDPVWVGGAEVTAFHAFGPSLGASANLTLISYRGTCWIGVTTDAGAVPDTAAFADCLRSGFDEVLDLAGAHEPTRVVAADPG